MDRARDRLDWKWLDTVNLTPTIITRMIYQAYLAFPIAVVDFMIIAPIFFILAVFFVTHISHFLNAVLFRIGLISSETSDYIQNFYNIGLDKLIDKASRLSEMVGQIVGGILFFMLGLFLVLCVRRILASLLRDELWALITLTIFATMFFLIGFVIVTYNDINNIAPFTSRKSIGVLIDATVPLIFVLLHVGAVLILRRRKYFRAECQFGTPGIRTFLQRFALSRGPNAIAEISLTRWSVSQGFRILAVAMGVVSIMGSIIATGGRYGEIDLLILALTWISAISILVAIYRSLYYDKFGKWNFLFIFFVFLIYIDEWRVPGIFNRSDYFALFLTLLVYICKPWLFQPSRRIVDMWRARAVVAAPHLVIKQRADTAFILRSFQNEDETSKIKPSNLVLTFAFGGDRVRKTIEEVVIGALSRRYALLTAADPQRDMNVVGAARAVLPNDDWHDYVIERMIEARVVIVILGTTESLSWEISQAIKLGILEKLVFVLPDGFFAKYTLAEVSPSLPELLGVKGEGVEAALGVNVRVIAFDADERVWRAYSTSGTSERNYLFCIRAAVGLADRKNLVRN